MKTCFSLFILLGLSTQLMAQKMLNLTEAHIRTAFEHIEYSGYQLTKTEGVLVAVKKEGEAIQTMRFFFDDKGKCRQESFSSTNSDLFQKELNKRISNKTYEWRKLNGNQYISSYTQQKMLEVELDSNPLTFNVISVELSVEMYKLLTENL